MNRRGFFGRLVSGVVAAVTAKRIGTNVTAPDQIVVTLDGKRIADAAMPFVPLTTDRLIGIALNPAKSGGDIVEVQMGPSIVEFKAESQVHPGDWLILDNDAGTVRGINRAHGTDPKTPPAGR